MNLDNFDEQNQHLDMDNNLAWVLSVLCIVFQDMSQKQTHGREKRERTEG